MCGNALLQKPTRLPGILSRLAAAVVWRARRHRPPSHDHRRARSASEVPCRGEVRVWSSGMLHCGHPVVSEKKRCPPKIFDTAEERFKTILISHKRRGGA